MVSVWLYVAFILATGGERIGELVTSRRHAAIAFSRGGVEYGKGHFPWMVALHTGLLLACIVEVVAFQRPFIPALGWPMLVIAVLCQVGRVWIIRSLGEQWNTRVIVVPGAARVIGRGPYQWTWFPHPNYVLVAVEGIALPLIHTAWVTAIAFTVLNAVLLVGFRIPVEDKARTQLV